MLSFENRVHPAPLHAASALALAVTDWVAFGLNIATTMHAYWLVTLGTAFVGAALTALVQQRYAKDGLRRALIKGAVVVALVAVPLPLAGTALALAALTWAWMSAVSRADWHDGAWVSFAPARRRRFSHARSSTMSTKRHVLLQPASAAPILGSDWVVDLLSWFFELEMLSRAALAGSIFCAVVVSLVESVMRPAARGAALAKGALTGATVLAPGPILGSVVALSALAWSTALYVAERSPRSRR